MGLPFFEEGEVLIADREHILHNVLDTLTDVFGKMRVGTYRYKLAAVLLEAFEDGEGRQSNTDTLPESRGVYFKRLTVLSKELQYLIYLLVVVVEIYGFFMKSHHISQRVREVRKAVKTVPFYRFIDKSEIRRKHYIYLLFAVMRVVVEGEVELLYKVVYGAQDKVKIIG